MIPLDVYRIKGWWRPWRAEFDGAPCSYPSFTRRGAFRKGARGYEQARAADRALRIVEGTDG